MKVKAASWSLEALNCVSEIWNYSSVTTLQSNKDFLVQDGSPSLLVVCALHVLK